MAQMAAPTVSVVIPTHNRAAFLGEAIDSVLAQRYDDIDIIVVDDASTDDTPSVLARYAGRIRTIRRDECSHRPSRVINAGIRASRGELVAFLHSDDTWLPRKLELQVARLISRPDVGFVYGNAVALLPDGSLSDPLVPPHELLSGSILRALVHNMFVHASTFIVRRALLERAGLFDEDVCTGEDYHLLLRLAQMTGAASVAEPVACLRRHTGQLSAQLSDAINYGSGIAALDRLLARGDQPWTVQMAARRTIARFHARIALASLNENRPGQAWQELARAHRRYPFSRPAWASTLRALATAWRR